MLQLPGSCSANKVLLQRRSLHDDFEEFCGGSSPPTKFETDRNNLIVDMQMWKNQYYFVWTFNNSPLHL